PGVVAPLFLCRLQLRERLAFARFVDLFLFLAELNVDRDLGQGRQLGQDLSLGSAQEERLHQLAQTGSGTIVSFRFYRQNEAPRKMRPGMKKPGVQEVK